MKKFLAACLLIFVAGSFAFGAGRLDSVKAKKDKVVFSPPEKSKSNRSKIKNLFK
ncbi:MAG: hypothetical protein ABIA63_07055 [bacterium]